MGAELSPPEWTVHTSDTIESGGYGSYTVEEDWILRITDVAGQQVADVVCFDTDLTTRYSAGHTKLLNKKKQVSTGDTIYSRECEAMLTIREDTCGTNYLSNSTCSGEKNYARYGVKHTRNCRTNLLHATEEEGLEKVAISTSICTFMNVKTNPYGVKLNREPTSKPGDHIDFQALMDLKVFISNCPSRRNPCNGYEPTALEVLVYDPTDAGEPGGRE